MRRYLTTVVIAAAIAGGCAKPAEHPAARVDTTPVSVADSASSETQQARLTPPSKIPTTIEEWEQFDYSSNAIPATALAPLPLSEVQRVRGIIFGKHGRVFQDSTLQSWLMTRPWYRADAAFENARLSEGEKANLEVVREAEAAKHTQIEPGDMRFYQNRVITTAMLGQHSAPDWDVLEGEVLANHGYVFDREDGYETNQRALNVAAGDLQAYFDERYWYHREPDFLPSRLSAIEEQNLDTIAFAVMKQSKRSVSPGVMHLLKATPLTDTMLANVNLSDLRLIRNEIYARHGRIFHTAWLDSYFGSKPWYTRRKDYTDAELSPIEKANIALIVRREQELHEALGTKLLTKADVAGLDDEEARHLRNEIYARHGRRFKDPKLQRYFADFAWYKPNDGFRESQLNDIEKQNALIISEYEHQRYTEG
jgi:YARHG domain